MKLRPITTIVYTGHSEPSLFFLADGVGFRVIDLSEGELDLAAELALDDALAWGEDPRAPVPTGWRYASLREFLPPCTCGAGFEPSAH